MNALKLNSSFYDLNIGLSESTVPVPIENPHLIKYNDDVAKLIHFPERSNQNLNLLETLSGNAQIQDSNPVAQSYAGHQFGRFNPFLGDGRSVLLGDVNIDGSYWDIVLKGSGKTPFSFTGDGRASLSECLHEYEMSEQLTKHGVPVVRCLSVIEGQEQVYRSGFQSVAIVAMLSPSTVRFGSFENCFFRKDDNATKVLANYVIERHFQTCILEAGVYDYAEFFKQVVIRTAELIAQWQNIGFVHGMMNTDNFSIIGNTIDLGESSFTEDFDEEFIASKVDLQGRYAFGRQPIIGLWNCNVLAKSLSSLLSKKQLKAALSIYESTYLNRLN